MPKENLIGNNRIGGVTNLCNRRHTVDNSHKHDLRINNQLNSTS